MKTFWRWLSHTVEAVVRDRALLSQARQYAFPVTIKDVYIYGAACDIGYPTFKRWREIARSGEADETLHPLKRNGNIVACYRLVRHYRKGYVGSDLAYGDTGDNGDFRIAEIIDITNALNEGSDG